MTKLEELEELEAAYGAATPGEWVTGKGGTAYYPLQIRCVSSDWDSLIAAFHSWDAQKESNAKFIALAHNLMPTLIEAATELAKFIDYLDTASGDGAYEHEIQRALAILEKLK